MFVQRPDASLHTLRFGTGPRHLIAIGGWIGSGEVWLEVVGRLGAGWDSIVVDHRGTGVSACTADRITVADMVDDLFAVLDACGVDRAVIAAESMGAGVALEAALAFPDRVAGLALSGPAWKRPVPGANDAFLAAIAADFEGVVTEFAAACLPEAPDDDLRRWGRAILLRSSAERAAQLIECRAELTAEDHLAAIEAPTLILHGSDDVFVPLEEAQALAAGLPNATLQVLPGLGHAPMLSRPGLIAEAIGSAFGTA